MCGFLIIVDKNLNSIKAKKALDLMIHRGPDHQKTLQIQNMFLGFNRLAIQDLTNNGVQPMTLKKKDGDIHIMFNGEIYNFLDLKKRSMLLNENFTSKTDTEVILKLYNLFGIKKTLDLIQGMFSISILDSNKKKIYLVRDIYGQKPLYYTISNNLFVASSEIKSIIEYIENSSPDLFGSLSPIFQTGLSPGNHTMFENIKKVEPGEIVEFNYETLKLSRHKYLDLSNWVDKKEYERIDKLSEQDLENEFSERIKISVKKHSISDAKIATTLSLGLDSSLIYSLSKQNNKTENLLSVTYVSEEGEKNFLNKNVQQFIDKNNHKSFHSKNTNFIENIGDVSYFSETVGREDTMILMEISRLCKKENIKVLLTGDGADEISGAVDYQIIHYFRSLGYNNFISRKVNLILKNYFPKLFYSVNYYDPNNSNYFLFPNELSSLELPIDFLFYGVNKKKGYQKALESYDFIENKALRNYSSITLDDLSSRFERFLIRSDCYGMKNSVEIRTPYIDNELVKFALNTPINKKNKISLLSFNPKSLLKKVSGKNGVPHEIIKRPKEGTYFNYSKEYEKIIKNEKFEFLSELFKIKSKDIRERLINNNKTYFDREKFSFLSAEFLFQMFLNKKTPEQIKEEVVKNLN